MTSSNCTEDFLFCIEESTKTQETTINADSAASPISTSSNLGLAVGLPLAILMLTVIIAVVAYLLYRRKVEKRQR